MCECTRYKNCREATQLQSVSAVAYKRWLKTKSDKDSKAHKEALDKLIEHRRQAPQLQGTQFKPPVYRRSLKLAEQEWLNLERLAQETNSLATRGTTIEQPSWRALIRRIAQGELIISEKNT